MELEDGQLPQDGRIISIQPHNPEYEWPGEHVDFDVDARKNTESSFTNPKGSSSSQPVFRLIVLRTSILSMAQKVAVLDAYTEVQMGRDAQQIGSTTPRVRVKDMEVSKLHATAYWDGLRKEWNIVDMGSKHGTFLQSGLIAHNSHKVGERLSPPRVASLPRRLGHSDHLTLGSTTFMVHIHTNQRPCEECALSDLIGEIPLFPIYKNKNRTSKRTCDVAELDSEQHVSPTSERDPRKALTALKRSLLTRHEAPGNLPLPADSSRRSSEYIDRAARRRLLHPESRSDTPGTSAAPLPAFPPTNHDDGGRVMQDHSPLPQVPLQPAPLPSTNIGHQLLMKQGWLPGEALGTASEGRIRLIDPLETKCSLDRAGLGSAPSTSTTSALSSNTNWKEQAKLRRFGEVSW